MAAPAAGTGTSTSTRVSVVIAAHDMGRWALIQRAVRSVRAQGGDAQVVLAVDNNAALFERARAELIGVDVVLNAGPHGASATRNAGARVAEGTVIAFLDDDTEAQPGWIKALIAPLGDDRVVGVGGAVDPVWPAERPLWFPMEFGWVIGVSYVGLPSEPAAVRNVWSENMAVRATEFRQAGGFAENFGKVGNRSRPEDTEFCVRLAARHPGRHWWFEPDARVLHHLPPARGSFTFFVRRCYVEGTGKARLAERVGAAAALSSEYVYARATLPRGVLRGLGEFARGRPAGLLRSGAIVVGVLATAAGYVHGTLSMAAARRHGRR